MRYKSLFVAAAISALVLAGCSSTTSPSSSSTTTTAAPSKEVVCTARDDFKSSITALTSPSLRTGGKAGIQSALDTVKRNLDAVASSAKSAYKPQVDAVQSAVDDLEKALGNFGQRKRDEQPSGRRDSHRQRWHDGSGAGLGPTSRMPFRWRMSVATERPPSLHVAETLGQSDAGRRTLPQF